MSVAILGTDRRIVRSLDKTIKIWNTDGECIKTLEGRWWDGTNEWVLSVAILGPDRIVSGSYEHTVKIWNTDEDKGHSEDFSSVATLGPDRIV